MSGDLLHGGALDRMKAAFPKAPTPWVDLSTGINPFPHPIALSAPMIVADLCHLPTQAARIQCRNIMADAYNAPHAAVLLSPGSELLIRLLPTILNPSRVAVLSPSYGDHMRAWQASGCEVICVSDPLRRIDEVEVVVLCNPNNPDGRYFEPSILEGARKRLAAKGGYLIVDEAYAALTPEHSLAHLGGSDGLIVLRSMGKFYGLAGVRVGALIAPPRLREAMAERLGVWALSGSALRIAATVHADQTWQERIRKRLRKERSVLDTLFQTHDLPKATGTDLFAYLHIEDAHTVWRKLADAGVYVRRFRDNPHSLRIGLPASSEAFDRLDAALRSALTSARGPQR